MANYYCSARTNYVKLTDVEALKKSLNPFGCTVSSSNINADMHCILGNSEDGFSITVDDEDDQFTEFDFKKHVMPFVQEEEVLVIIEIGNEKLKYLTGEATALIRRGEVIDKTNISLDYIYNIAAERFGKPQGTITVAEY